LSQYIRTVYKLSSEASNKQTEQRTKLLSESPELADLAARIERDPKDGDARSRLAAAYIDHQLYWAAYELLSDFQPKNAEDIETNLNLARIWDVWGEYDLALKYAGHAIDNGASSAKAYELLGRIYLHRKEPSEAIGWYERAAREADDAIVLANLGYAYLLLSDWEKAKANLTKAIELDRTLPEPHNNLAVVLTKLGDEKGALSELMKTAKAPVAFNNMGVLYLKEKNIDQAQTFFEEALRLDPQYETAQRNLSAVQAATPPSAIIHLPSFRVHSLSDSIVTINCVEPEPPKPPTAKQEVSSSISVEKDLAGSTDIVETDPIPLEPTTALPVDVAKPNDSAVLPANNHREANEVTVEKANQRPAREEKEQTSDAASSVPSQTKAPEPEDRPAQEAASTDPPAQTCSYSSKFALHQPSSWNLDLENPRLVMGEIGLLLVAGVSFVSRRFSFSKAATVKSVTMAGLSSSAASRRTPLSRR
jgi:tetratricopeptide (TPR) repeat protein